MSGQPCKQSCSALEVLVDAPQRLHCSIAVVHEEIQRCWRQDLIREQNPAKHFYTICQVRFAGRAQLPVLGTSPNAVRASTYPENRSRRRLQWCPPGKEQQGRPKHDGCQQSLLRRRETGHDV